MIEVKVLRPDAKGRLTLGALAKGVSGFEITVDAINHRITLQPLMEVPAREQWLHMNEKALKKVKIGLQQSAEGKVTYKGSFARYADE